MFLKTVQCIVLFFFIVLFTYIIVERYQLKNNYLLSTAVITNAGLRMQKNGDYIVVYQFKTINGDIITKEEQYPIYYSRKDSLIGRSIPCAYYKKDFSRSQLLVYKQTWKQFGLVYPDSLVWTKKFFKEVIWSY